jgi:hypothetical protein
MQLTGGDIVEAGDQTEFDGCVEECRIVAEFVETPDGPHGGVTVMVPEATAYVQKSPVPVAVAFGPTDAPETE